MLTSENNVSKVCHSDLRKMAFHVSSSEDDMVSNSLIFARALLAHIVEEEASESWFVEIQEREPRLIPVMNDLTHQHRDLEKIADDILQACQSGDFEKLVKKMELCVALFETHEQTEDIIMEEYIYRDLGEV